MNEFQKILCMIDSHETTVFFTFMSILTPAIFLIHQISKNYLKVTAAEKFDTVKNQLFHACEPCKGFFEIRSYRAIIFRAVCLKMKLLTLFHFCNLPKLDIVTPKDILFPYMSVSG